MRIVADQHIPFVKEYFASCGELILKSGRTISSQDVKSADMLLVRSVTSVDEKLLKDSPVRFVGSVTAGADHLEADWLNAAGIAWKVAHGFNAPPVADYVISAIAGLERTQVLTSDRKRAAVIGVGSVGSLVVARLKLLGFEVMCCDPLRAAQEPDFESVALTDINDVDLIALHVPLTRTGDYPTYHMIDKLFLWRQKPGCVLLNAGRGSVIHQEDLLEFGKHLFWCFDVWSHEPNISKSILERAIIGTPHIAGYSVQSKMRGTEMIYRAACELGLIQEDSKPAITMPVQTLAFPKRALHWRDVVLGIFNPMIMTAMMRSTLLPAETTNDLFDEMRHQFNYRHEFAYTQINGGDLPENDRAILSQLGIKMT